MQSATNAPTARQRTEIAVLAGVHPVTAYRVYLGLAGHLATAVVAEAARRLGLPEPPQRRTDADRVTP